MTRRMTPVRRGPALPAAAVAALLLAGCSSGHVGDSWQCPLATGGACDSVAAADPAVPDRQAARGTVLKEPLWRQRAGAPEALAPEPCEADCGGGFDPFGWLVRLFGASGSGARPGLDPGAGTRGEEDGPPAKPNSPSATDTVRPPKSEPEPARSAAATLPAEPVSAKGDSSGDDLRTGEVVARIWIAPFVDANGVYREASHVHVVLEPAGWRLR